MDSRGKIAFIATVDVHIYAFHIPFMKKLEGMGFKVEVMCADTGFTERIEKEGFVVHKIPFSRNPLSLSNAGAFIILLHLLKANNYIMIHTHTPVASFLGRIAGKIAKVPHILYTAHGFHFHEYGSKLRNFLYYRLEKFAGRFTDILITINTDDYKIAKEKNLVPNGKIVYIKGVGVDTEVFRVDNDYKAWSDLRTIDTNILRLVTVGRIEREKNYFDLIRVAFKVKQMGIKFKLFIVGSGPLEERIVSFAEKLNLKDDCVFTGYVEDTRDILKNSDIFLFASSREGLPVSVMEAMATELPVVAYNIRGVRDLVVKGVTGFLVPFRGIESFAEKINYLYNHPEVAKDMGRRARERIVREFSLGIILKDMEKLYRQILEENP